MLASFTIHEDSTGSALLLFSFVLSTGQNLNPHHVATTDIQANRPSEVGHPKLTNKTKTRCPVM